MTCSHVLGLIDAAPVSDYPRAHLEIAWAHARTCHICGPALEAASMLPVRFRGLEPRTAVPDLKERVMARIADAPRARAADVESAPATEAIAMWAPWANAVGLAASVVALVWSMAAGGGEGIDATGMVISITPAAMPLFAAGLIVYVASLFSAADAGR